MEIPQGWLSKIISRANRAIYFFSNIFKEEDSSCVEYHSHQLLTLLSLVQSDEVTSNRETARRCILVLRQSFKLFFHPSKIQNQPLNPSFHLLHLHLLHLHLLITVALLPLSVPCFFVSGSLIWHYPLLP